SAWQRAELLFVEVLKRRFQGDFSSDFPHGEGQSVACSLLLLRSNTLNPLTDQLELERLYGARRVTGELRGAPGEVVDDCRDGLRIVTEGFSLESIIFN